MRGPIPDDRMAQVQSRLLASYDLRQRIPHFQELLIGVPPAGLGLGRFRALRRLVDGWHMLNQARLALVEADACKIFYEEIQPEVTESRYRCRFYLDDAALRLCSSCEHLLHFAIRYWNLPVARRKVRDDKGPTPLLVRVIQASEKSPLPEVRLSVAKPLRNLRSNKHWIECVKYRNAWVHNELPAVDGLGCALSFREIGEKERNVIESLVGLPRVPIRMPRWGMTVKTGLDIDQLHRHITQAYAALYRALEGFLDTCGVG